MQSIWVVVANANRCRIFQCQPYAKELMLTREYEHAASKQRDQDLVSDRKGQFRSSGGSGLGVYMEAHSPKKIEQDVFARELAQELESGRCSQDYEQLIIIATPPFHGMLMKHMSTNAERNVLAHVQKDYTDFELGQLKSYLHENWRELVYH